MAAEWNRSALIEQDSHSHHFQRPRGMFQDGTGLLLGDTREPFQKFPHRRSTFNILEQSGHGDARAAKHPRTADTISVAFNSNAGSPVDHSAILRLELKVLNVSRNTVCGTNGVAMRCRSPWVVDRPIYFSP
jgi:hypothetical protein